MNNIIIDQLGLSSRAANCLHRNGVDNLKQLMNLSEDDLFKMRNMGKKSAGEILELQGKYKNTEIDDFFEMQINKSVDSPKSISDLNISKSNISNKAFIFRVFPQFRGLLISHFLYKDINGDINKDIELERTPLSIRVINALNNKGIDSIDTIAKMNEDDLFKIRNLGRTSINEIIKYMENNVEVVLLADSDVNNSIADEDNLVAYRLISDYCCSNGFSVSFLKNSIIENDQKNKDYYQIESIEDITRNKDIINNLFIQDNVISDMAQYIKWIIKQSDAPQTKHSLHRLFPDFLFEIGLIDLSLERLIKEGDILLKNIGYVFNRIKLNDWITSLPEKENLILSLRVNKKTLEECGERIGVTRERVRQIEAKVIKKKPKLYEDYYADWFQEYWFDRESFITIFDESEEVYYYLNIAYTSGIKPVDLFAKEEQITSELYKKCKFYEVRNCLLIDGEYIPNNRYDILKNVIKLYCSKESVTTSAFFEIYNKFLSENEYNKYEKLLLPSARALEGRISDYDYVLMGLHHKFRYYPIKEMDVLDITDQINLSKYKDVEISTLKIFNDNRNLMEEIDIRDEYELHNFLKKTESIWNNNYRDIRFLRMPGISFGNADRDKQAEDLLFQIAPVSYEEFGQFYEMEYGVRAATVNANRPSSISKYYHNGIYEINQPVLDETEFNYMETNLDENFYFVQDVKNIYLKQFGEQTVDRINPRTLKELHFKVYVDYIIRDTFSSAYDYFYTLFSSKDVFTIEQYDKRLSCVQTANQAIEDLRSSYDILEYEDMKFISYKRLNSVHNDITKVTLNEYVSKVDSYVSDGYFTIHNLIKHGLADRLHDIGFGEWFIAAIVKNSRKYKFIKSGGNIIFSRDVKQITTVDFLRYVMTKIRKMNIFEFIVYLKNTYNVNLSKDKIIYMIKDSDLYYDSIMKKIYINKDEYYEEV